MIPQTKPANLCANLKITLLISIPRREKETNDAYFPRSTNENEVIHIFTKLENSFPFELNL